MGNSLFGFNIGSIEFVSVIVDKYLLIRVCVIDCEGNFNI